MIEILSALKAFLEMDAVVTVLGTLDVGLNVASLFGILKSKFEKDSVEYQIIYALDESLNESCKKLGWEYDVLAVSQEIDLDTLISSTLMTKHGLGQLFAKLVGVEVDNDELDVIIDCFDKNVAGKGKLHRYLDQKWKRYIDEIKNTPAPVPISLTIIPAPVDLIGREDDVIAIRSALTENNVVYIRADGGFGKTAVATRIINDVKGEIELGDTLFKHVAWITSTSNLQSDLSDLTDPSAEAAESIDERFKMACAFLEDNSTFLIIDNMDYLPSPDEINILNTVSGRTKILITTRIKIDRFKQYPLKPFEKKDAICLFYRHYLNNTEIITTDNRTEERYVEKIVEAVSSNALLVELTAKMAYWEYSGNLENLWEKLEKDVFGTNSEIDLETEHADSHKYGVLSEGDLKLQEQIRNLYRISGLDKTKQELVRFIAIFPAETIIFGDVFKWAGFKISDMKYLADRGWIEKAGGGYLIHTMVQGSVILQKNEFDIEKYENLIKELSDTDQYMPETMLYCKMAGRFLILETIGKLLAEKGSQKDFVGTLFYYLGRSYFTQGSYDNALEYYEKALAISEKASGPEHESIAPVYSNIAMGHKEKGNYEKALEYNYKALAIFEKELGHEDPSTATVYNNIAEIYHTQEHYDNAVEYYSKAIAIFEAVYGTDHHRTAISYGNLAGVYHAKGEYDKSLELYEKVISVEEKALGLNHPSTATSYNNVAGVYLSLKKFDKALEYYEKAIDIREKVLGFNHLYTAMTYSNIGGVYYAQGDYENALMNKEKALAIEKRMLGNEHPSVAKTYKELALVYKDQKEFDNAIKYYGKALAIQEKVLGVEHLDTAMTYNSIAVIYLAKENYDTALEYYSKGLVIQEKLLGVVHLDTAATYNGIAVIYYAKEEYDKSLMYFKKALAIQEKILEPKHLSIAMTYSNLAGVYCAQGEYDKALEYNGKALSIQEKILRQDNLFTARMYTNLGTIYILMRQYAEAKKYLQRAYATYRNALGEEHLYTKSTLSYLEAVQKEEIVLPSISKSFIYIDMNT